MTTELGVPYPSSTRQRRSCDLSEPCLLTPSQPRLWKQAKVVVVDRSE